MLGHKEGEREAELERERETGWTVGGAGGQGETDKDAPPRKYLQTQQNGCHT